MKPLRREPLDLQKVTQFKCQVMDQNQENVADIPIQSATPGSTKLAQVLQCKERKGQFLYTAEYYAFYDII